MAGEAEVHDLNFFREFKQQQRQQEGGGGPPDGGTPTDEGPRPTWASDDALALELATRLAGSWHYVARWDDWFYWNGKIWVRDAGLSVMRDVRELCRSTSARIESHGLARNVSGGRTIFNVEKLARSDQRLARQAEEFDADDWLLNTPGGIVDLRNGQLYPHDPRKLMTQMAGATPEGDCPVWRQFLAELTDGDQSYQDYLQRVVGYSLTGSTEEEIFVFLYGPANTGKSKFVETVRRLHGSYGCSASMDVFIATQNHGHLTEIARFVGKRLVTAAETDENCRWDQQRMTTLSGRDEVVANFMRQDQFSYYPKFLLAFHGNHRPRLVSDGGAMKRRMQLLPCKHRPARIDKRLIDKLDRELGGIMRWAVEGAVLWRTEGLRPPLVVTRATDEYFKTENTIETWIDERCERDKSLFSETREIYQDYTSWAKATGEFVFSEKRFCNALENLGFDRGQHEKTRRHGFRGLGLKVRNQDLGV